MEKAIGNVEQFLSAPPPEAGNDFAPLPAQNNEAAE